MYKQVADAAGRARPGLPILEVPDERAHPGAARRGGGLGAQLQQRPGAQESAGRSDEWEARRRAEEARYDTGGDSFGALLGDLVSATAKAFGGGAGGWARTSPLPRSRRHHSLGHQQLFAKSRLPRAVRRELLAESC